MMIMLVVGVCCCCALSSGGILALYYMHDGFGDWVDENILGKDGDDEGEDEDSPTTCDGTDANYNNPNYYDVTHCTGKSVKGRCYKGMHPYNKDKCCENPWSTACESI